MCSVAQHHDRIVNALFSNTEDAATALSTALPEAIAERIEWSTLQHSNLSLVDPKLRAFYSDIVFYVQLEEHDIERSASASKQLAQINAAGSVPTFIVEQKAIIGFHPWGLEDAIDEAARSHYCADDLEAAVCERPRMRR